MGLPSILDKRRDMRPVPFADLLIGEKILQVEGSVIGHNHSINWHWPAVPNIFAVEKYPRLDNLII